MTTAEAPQTTEGQVTPSPAGPPAPAAPAAPPPAPVYEFKAPEGVSFDADALKVYTDTVRDLKLAPEAAQKLLDKIAPTLHQRQQMQIESIREQWKKETAADRELGAAQEAQVAPVIATALEKLGTPELVDFVNNTGLIHQKDFRRLLLRAGKLVSEDRLERPNGVTSPMTSDDLASVLYPNHPKS